MSETIKIALADDHVALRNGLALLIKMLGYTVLFEGSNGKELIQSLNNDNLPDVILMDINMPQMDGFATTDWLKKHHPTIKVLALSMYDDEGAIIRMLKSGARGYLLKSAEADDLRRAIDNVYAKGFHYSEMVTGTLFRANYQDEDAGKVANLSDRELHFLKLASTELTYKEIADEMYVSPRTVDGYRETLFEKLDVKSRIGLVLFAIKNRIVHIG
ncbi:response regulator transcription factor [Spirosoma profusum]|uniref:response regulator transcription factor n=1 Tax=Spirosoma profusum TaxID=2771354 RepID=UPI00293BBD76|nr:response regulator transcription factor [Spirosoma profusum]